MSPDCTKIPPFSNANTPLFFLTTGTGWVVVRTVVAPPLSVVECGVGGSFVWLFVCGLVLVALLCV